MTARKRLQELSTTIWESLLDLVRRLDRAIGTVVDPLLTNQALVVIAVSVFLFAGTVGTGVAAVDRPASSAIDAGASAFTDVVEPKEPDSDDAATSASTPTATVQTSVPDTPTPTSQDSLEYTAGIVAAANDARQNRDLPSIQENGKLSEVAQYHADQMAREGFFSHTSPDGEGFSDRMRRFGYSGGGCAENLFLSSQTGVSPTTLGDMTISSWLDSDGHRKNLLGAYAQTGVGVAEGEIDGYHSVVVVQVYC